MTDTNLTEHAPPALSEQCPQCGHAWHDSPCLNMASDSDCNCAGSKPMPAGPFDAKEFVLSITRDEASIRYMSFSERVAERKEFVAERVAELLPHLKGTP